MSSTMDTFPNNPGPGQTTLMPYPDDRVVGLSVNPY